MVETCASTAGGGMRAPPKCGADAGMPLAVDTDIDP